MADTPTPANSGSAGKSNLRSLPSPRKEDAIALRRWTMAGLALAVVIGLIVCALHGGTVTVSVAALGASLGLGGVLGFLFGIPTPGSSKPSVNINQVNTAGVVEGGQGGDANSGQAGAQNPNPDPQAQNRAAAAGDGKPELAPPQPSTSAAAPSGHVSNLEQVADWVTKLLLGGGLTQMQRIPPKIWQWSHVVAVGILRSSGGSTEQLIVAEQAFACGLMVYGFILGFFAGFLITKLQLGKAIAD